MAITSNRSAVSLVRQGDRGFRSKGTARAAVTITFRSERDPNGNTFNLSAAGVTAEGKSFKILLEHLLDTRELIGARIISPADALDHKERPEPAVIHWD